MKYFISMTLIFCSSIALANEGNDDTEARAQSERHQAGITRTANAPVAPTFGGYDNNTRRGDKVYADKLIEEMLGSSRKAGNSRPSEKVD